MGKVTQKFVMETPLFNACVLRAKPGVLDTRDKRREFANALKEEYNSGTEIRWNEVNLLVAFLWASSPRGWQYWFDLNTNTY